MPKLLLTRPESDNEHWAKLLGSMGIETIASPLLHIEHLSKPIDCKDYSGIIITSKHAVIPAAECGNLPAYLIGNATAAHAKDYGFSHIAAIAPTARELLALIPAAQGEKPLLYASGEVTSVDVVKLLEERGINAKQEIVYKAIAAESLSAEAERALAQGEIDGVLLFSARTAEIFQGLTSHRHVTLFCLSEAIAHACAPDEQWREVLFPESPTAEALATLIHEYYQN